jgi:hypothetical protein
MDSSDDPIMRQHPNWDNLEYKFVFDIFKGVPLINTLQFLETTKLKLLTYQNWYYSRNLKTELSGE